jgi:hypothetical protein
MDSTAFSPSKENNSKIDENQLHLTGAAQSWLSKLLKDSVGSWNELKKTIY